ncbi:hypothetical protein ADIS_0157 [Lunatimonas lonarensis]|uniref:Uncharacterized protein n=1 Tax=Lunatimonas lonarensis TaxID=1232681 RepID=R7ZZ40_9BACT|nr:hypothetical protein ADIS_0157 [Lunatimonas lonarensis]
MANVLSPCTAFDPELFKEQYKISAQFFNLIVFLHRCLVGFSAEFYLLPPLCSGP